jgi:hypothetical protein
MGIDPDNVSGMWSRHRKQVGDDETAKMLRRPSRTTRMLS